MKYISNAFYRNGTVEKLSIGSGATLIGANAFYYCPRISTLRFTTDSIVEKIDNYAFQGCRVLSEVSLPASVKTIGQYAFCGCDSLVKFEIPDNSSLVTIAGNAFRDCSSLASIAIPSSLKTVGEYAFYGCTSLKKVSTYASNLETIGTYAFFGCESLTEIRIPATVTSIGNHAFRRCALLSQFTVDYGNYTYSSIDGNLYNYNGTTLIQYATGKTDELFTVPDGVTKIGDHAFYYCLGIKSITIPEGVTSIDAYAFAFCSGLESISIPSSVVFLNNSVFRFCTGLKSITVAASSNSFKTIDGSLYTKDGAKLIQYTTGSANKTFILPDTVKTISSYALCGSYNLESVVLPKSLKTIEDSAFYNCSALKTVYFMGSSAVWSTVSVSANGNVNIGKLPRYYYSKTKPAGAGNFWHYDKDGNIAVW